MDVLDLLKGKKILVKTDVGVEVELEIKEVKEQNHSQALEPATRENDWWPASRDWTTYKVTFTNGHSKEYSSIKEIKISEEKEVSDSDDKLPKTLKEAVDSLVPKFEGMEEYFKKTEDSFAAYCHSQLSGGIGMQIRNQFGFWTKDTELYKHLKEVYKLKDADSMSDLILRHVYRKVNSK